MSSSSSNRAIVGILVVVALAIAFWVLMLSPKREQTDKLATEVEQQEIALSEAQSKVAEATAAKTQFPEDYRQLVVLGKAVPANDESASLLVELNRVSKRAHVKFESLDLSSNAGTGEEVSEVTKTAGPTAAVPAAATVPPTEAEAALLPLGATIGSANLAVMPYSLSFTGNFFDVADFIHGMDSLIQPGKTEVGVDGRLVTLDGFSLIPDAFPKLTANFAVTTYLVPPGEGITAGASSTTPAVPVETTEAPTTTGTPSAYTTEGAR